MGTCLLFSYYIQNKEGIVRTDPVDKKNSCSFVPLILISRTKFIVYLYDSVNDVMLLTGDIPLFDNGGLGQRLDRYSVMFMWCILNHKFTMPDKILLPHNSTSNFHQRSQRIDFYKNITLGEKALPAAPPPNTISVVPWGKWHKDKDMEVL